MRWNEAIEWIVQIPGVQKYSLNFMNPDIDKTFNNADTVWWRLLKKVENGRPRHTRGTTSYEKLGETYVIDPSFPLVTNSQRNVSLSFAIGELIWIMSGRSSLDEVLPYNKRIKQFLSVDKNNSVRGAYGPKIVSQLSKIVSLLHKDGLSSRRAVIYIADSHELMSSQDSGNPSLPCTSTIQFIVQDFLVHCFVTMRSQDLWLGFPYDTFLFCHLLNTVTQLLQNLGHSVFPGSLNVTVGSLHIYDTMMSEVHNNVSFPSNTWKLPFNMVDQDLITTETLLRQGNLTKYFSNNTFFSQVLYRFWRPDNCSNKKELSC